MFHQHSRLCSLVFKLSRTVILCATNSEIVEDRGSRPGISTYTLNYESWSVMDKLEYATTTNLRLRLAGMLMDMWIFFLFVAIAGECKTILFSYLSFRSRYVTFRFDSTQFSDSRPPCACVCSRSCVSIRRVARSVTWSACCHSTCQYALRMHNRHVRHAE